MLSQGLDFISFYWSNSFPGFVGLAFSLCILFIEASFTTAKRSEQTTCSLSIRISMTAIAKKEVSVSELGEVHFGW